MTPPNRNDFRFYDVSDFPIVRIRGSALPAGYAAQWIKEMEALLTNAEPFAFVFLDNAEHPEHEDQKAQMQWLKANKKALARICRGIASVEPDRARAIGAALQAAGPGDTLLIAGKGHETYQEVAGRMTHFDDREVVRNLLAEGL